MDWGILISAVISILTCGGMVWWLNPKAAKKKPELENENTAVETMRDAIDEIRKSNDHFQLVNEQKDKLIEKLQNELIEKTKDLSICNTYICSHLGCASRKPPRASADKWLEDLKDEKTNVDYTPIICTTLIKQNENEFENKKS